VVLRRKHRGLYSGYIEAYTYKHAPIAKKPGSDTHIMSGFATMPNGVFVACSKLFVELEHAGLSDRCHVY
jgi:hypothetical protein